MPEIHFMPDDKKIQVRPGTTLLDAGRKARVNIRTRCDGKAACLMCKVKVADQSGLAAPKVNEINKLGDLIADCFRLACQSTVTGNVRVELPEDPLKAAIRAQLERQKQQDEDW